MDGEPAPEGAPSGQQANVTVDRGLDSPFPPEVNGSTGVDGPGVDRAEPQVVSSTVDVSGAVVREWNESALQAIRSSKPVPTVITRALHLLHAAIYDVWAAYQPNAQGAYSQISRNPSAGSAGVESAISHAAMRCCHVYSRSNRTCSMVCWPNSLPVLSRQVQRAWELRSRKRCLRPGRMMAPMPPTTTPTARVTPASMIRTACWWIPTAGPR